MHFHRIKCDRKFCLLDLFFYMFYKMFSCLLFTADVVDDFVDDVCFHNSPSFAFTLSLLLIRVFISMLMAILIW